jgi:hypothetical protein
MLAVAGAILIHAACILMATPKESADLYAMRLFLIIVGSALIGAVIANRFLELRRKLPLSAQTQAPRAEADTTRDRGG